MAYSRFPAPYVYPTCGDVILCDACRLGGAKDWTVFTAETPEEMFWHLVAHINEDDPPDEGAMERLLAEAEEEAG